MLTVEAPASITACTTSARNSGSEREASSGLNSKSSTRVRANATLSRAWRTISSVALPSLYWRWMALVARKMWMRARPPAGRTASPARSMSPLSARARPQMRGRGDREAGLDDVDAQGLEGAGDLELLGQVHRCARRLLAVTQGGVEDDDAVGG